jgi:hypothetical protein
MNNGGKSMKSETLIDFPEGCRVRVRETDDPHFAGPAKVVVALPNPSRKRENQWYDVRFDSGRWARFPGRLLEFVESKEHHTEHETQPQEHLSTVR